MALGLAFAACNPVQADAVDALGGEAPGVPHGPLHRPGQPCLLCHTGDLGDPPQFTVAGTIYKDATTKTAATGAMVKVTGSDGATAQKTTNAAGNFYFEPRDYAPVWPIRVAVTYAGVTVEMTSPIGRDGSCGSCHADPASPMSAGHVYIPADGGAP